MSRVCTVCTHAERAAIDAALVAGDASRDVARRFGLSATAASRHRTAHLPRPPARATPRAAAEAVAPTGPAAAGPPRQPWEQRAGESGKAYAAFLAYRDLGAARSIEKVGRKWGAARSL